jgi:hypothetical protein
MLHISPSSATVKSPRVLEFSSDSSKVVKEKLLDVEGVPAESFDIRSDDWIIYSIMMDYQIIRLL